MPDNECMVSVLCTAYNHEQYLRECLDGFISQKTDFPFEVLVNDDCSADATAAVIREYASKYPEIIRPFYQKENLFSRLGMPGLFEKVFYPNARGRYIALCEGDDKWCDCEKLQRQVDFLEAHPDYSACVHNTVLHFCAEPDADRPLIAEKGDRDVDFETVVTGMSNAFHTSSILARREYIISPPDFHYVAGSYGFTDYAIGLWLTMNGKVRFLDREMSVYRISSNPEAWSSNLGRSYGKLKEFVTGEIAMIETLLPRLKGEKLRAAERELTLRRYELYDITGQVEKLYEKPYLDILKAKPFSYRLKTGIKKTFPAFHAYYRRKQGYGE